MCKAADTEIKDFPKEPKIQMYAGEVKFVDSRKRNFYEKSYFFTLPPLTMYALSAIFIMGRSFLESV